MIERDRPYLRLARSIAPWTAATATLAAIAWGAAGGCDGPTVPPYDRGALLEELVDRTILPGQRALADRGRELEGALDALCASGGLDEAHLVTAQEAWRQAYLAWERTRAYQIGPAMDENLDAELAYFPADAAAIEADVAGTATLDAAWVHEIGAPHKGLFAIEHLLFAPGDAAAVLASLGAPRRCELLVALGAGAASAAAAIDDAWEPDGGGFATTVMTAGQPGNAMYSAQLSALSAILSELLQTLEELKVGGMARPLGLLDGGVPQPDAIEARLAGAATAGMRARLEGVRAVWQPAGASHDFDGHLRSRRAALADQVLAELHASEAALAAIPEPYAEHVAGAEHAAADAAYAAVRTLERTLGAQVSAVLAVSVMFTDSDGD